MNDKEVGKLWQDAVSRDSDDTELADYAARVVRLVRKIVEERALYYSVVDGNAPGYGPAERYKQRARRDFGIPPESFKR